VAWPEEKTTFALPSTKNAVVTWKKRKCAE